MRLFGLADWVIERFAAQRRHRIRRLRLLHGAEHCVRDQHEHDDHRLQEVPFQLVDHHDGENHHQRHERPVGHQCNQRGEDSRNGCADEWNE